MTCYVTLTRLLINAHTVYVDFHIVLIIISFILILSTESYKIIKAPKLQLQIKIASIIKIYYIKIIHLKKLLFNKYKNKIM